MKISRLVQSVIWNIFLVSQHDRYTPSLMFNLVTEIEFFANSGEKIYFDTFLFISAKIGLQV